MRLKHLTVAAKRATSFLPKLARNKVRAVAAAFGVLLTCEAAVANTFCQGTIDAVTVGPNGVVTVYSQGAGLNWVLLCNVGVLENGVSAESCKGILAVLVAAKVSGTPVQWAFTDSVACGQSLPGRGC